MALPEAAQVELTKRYQARLASIRNRVGAAAAQAWDGLDSYDEKDVARYERRIAQAVDTARAATVETSAAYYSTLANVDPPAIDPTTVVASLDSRDPFISTWQALKAGTDYVDAVAAGRSRAEAAAGDFVQSTSRLTGDAVTTASGQRIVGWRRVLTGSSCEWCRTISTQRYKSSESADFGHNRCDCTAVPIYGDADPGRILNDTIAPPPPLVPVDDGFKIDPRLAPFEAEMRAARAKMVEAFPNAPHTSELRVDPDQRALGNKSHTYITVSEDFLDDAFMANRAKEFGSIDPDNIGRLLTGNSRENVVVHEYSHQLDGWFQRDDPKGYQALTDWLQADSDRLGRDGEVIQRMRRMDNPDGAPSIYALENRYEYVAEALADAVLNGDAARPASRYVFDLFRQKYA